MKKFDIFILSVVLVVAFVFRLYKINIPLADLHSWRQVDTAAVARNFAKNGGAVIVTIKPNIVQAIKRFASVGP